jgi:AraC family transcriptional regulator
VLINTDDFYKESIQKAIQFLEENAANRIQLQDVADYAFLSPFHFHRIFKTYTHTTTKQYLTRIRLEKAAHLMQYQNVDIAQIAFEVGYDNYETFNRAFKAYFDKTPSQFKAEAQEKNLSKQGFYQQNNLELSSVSIEKLPIVYLPTTHLAYIRHTGSYENVGKTWNKLTFWALRHFQIGRHTTTLGIVHDNPDITDTDNIRYDACLVLKKPMEGKGDIGFKQIKEGRYAVFRYKGAYEHFYTVYDYIYSVCLRELGYKLRNEPALEWYVKSPPFYRPENFVTDFYVPIE